MEQQQIISMRKPGGLLVLPAGAAEVSFIVDSWCRSFERPALAALNLPEPHAIPKSLRRLICSAVHARVLGVLSRPTARALYLAYEGAPSVILGYVVSEGARLHYTYVLENLRRMGLATMLLEAANLRGGTYTHHTPAGAALARRFRLTFSPEETNPC